jgi:WD40-like Beta Propeller Repeat
MRARLLILGVVPSLCVMVLVGVLVLGSAPAFAAGPPVLEEEGSVLNVTSTSAKLQAQINPEESETTYRFEYGTSEAYGSQIPLPDGLVGSGAVGVTVRVEPEGLLPGTTYHYRVVAMVAARKETKDGTDKTFVTQPVGEFALPDDRQWGLVSPPNKHGATIYPLGEWGVIQAAEDGSAISYVADAPTELEPKGFGQTDVQVLSKRVGEGWSSQDIATPNDAPTNFAPGFGLEYRFFSSDLSLALVEPIQEGFTPLSAEATERTTYIRNDAGCEAAPVTCYEPILTAADVRAGVKFGGKDLEVPHPAAEFVGATPDLSHVVVRYTNEGEGGLTSTPGDDGGLYEWAAGQLRLVSILPENEGGQSATEDPNLGHRQTSSRGAISEDGSRVFWDTTPSFAENLYLRDVAKGANGETLRIGGGVARFQVANSEGSRVFFLGENESTNREGELEVCDVVEKAGKLACETTPLASNVQETVVGASEDGSYVYFVSTAALAPKAVAGEDNLYVDHENGGTWEPEFIAALPAEDHNDWAGELKSLTARVSPNGKWLAFMSQKRLTGYDNRDANSGEPDEEVYLYSAVGKRLICASCNPTGARPVGMQYGTDGEYFAKGLLGGGNRVWETTTWLAANIPGWDPAGDEGRTMYQERYLSNSGRLFFNSGDALVPQDVNGTWDVYEYEPIGEGNCSEMSTTFSARSGGCVDLISSGQSPEQSAFLDASENGDDVFFLTADQLVARDTDTSFDVYDAHVCSSGLPCAVRPVSPPPCSSGDACKVAPSPQPAIFGAPASGTFKGIGDVAAPSGPGVAPKSLTRAQRLARALRACEKQPKKKRGVCKRRAGKRYRAVQSPKATSTKRGAQR